MVGRERCDAVVATAVEQSPQVSEMAFAGRDRRAMRERWEQRVRLVYRDRCGFALTTMLLWWAIGAIVEALVRKWWEEHT
jgi:hypothetical protein